ncbi:MAG: hypothetical protein ACYC8T_07875 [Myxococcaceae bacterium]
MRRIETLGALLAMLLAVACDDEKSRWDKPYSSTAALLCLEPGQIGNVDTWNLSCAYLAVNGCGGQATFVEFVGEWSRCWELVDECMVGKSCIVPAAKLAGRPLGDPSTGRTRSGATLSGGPDAGNVTADCAVVAAAAVPGACNIQLMTPVPCEEVDLSGGKVYRATWTTTATCSDGTVHVFGNPPGPTNRATLPVSGTSLDVTLTLATTTSPPLTSTNGVYYWYVEGPDGSHPASQSFRIKR